METSEKLADEAAKLKLGASMNSRRAKGVELIRREPVWMVIYVGSWPTMMEDAARWIKDNSGL
jgi:hypothetical protein